ncbi:putative glutathione-dependent formaldehyde-activating protein [Emericellopsis atlantica]|uniref:Glutathione-dependent formaldehyde-activating protein n=1 Tax=Emericellopsis atlantica TaxID=2614577 RepID=A0A9P8CWP9_9HYPO|nr:putative glutathione-dependent formaldehyde-activating protein [Emericellopsis atlantica]KAG9258661.1 putative glutathione-dependent formaldehyde-activating protein [Emericellopsis atlantica]
MNMPDKIVGGCLCEAVRYQFDVGSSTIPPSTCKCTQCRKQSGALNVHFLKVPLSSLSWLRNKETWSRDAPPDLTIFRASPGSPEITRGFCAKCGGLVYWRDGRTDMTSITLGTFDEGMLRGRSSVLADAKARL